MVNIKFKSEKSFYCSFERHIINVNSINDLKLICSLLKRNNINYNVEKSFLKDYEIKVLNKWIGSYSDNSNCKNLDCSLNSDISSISFY